MLRITRIKNMITDKNFTQNLAHVGSAIRGEGETQIVLGNGGEPSI